MTIRIICVGKLKEKYWSQAAAEYIKRLSRYCKTELVEVKDEPVPEKFSEAQRRQAVDGEGEKILRHLPASGVICTLEINGRAMSSVAFAEKIEALITNGDSTITFIIGGSLGLSEKVLSRSHWRLSFSPMTFPHQLFRIMLLEQLYRAFKINHHETYHK